MSRRISRRAHARRAHRLFARALVRAYARAYNAGRAEDGPQHLQAAEDARSLVARLEAIIWQAVK